MSIDKLKTKFFTGAWLTDVKHYFTKINEIIDYLNSLVSYSPPYKVYTALLTQTGTNAPVAIILENTLGTVTLSRSGVGNYTLTTNGLFTNNKSFELKPAMSGGDLVFLTYSNVNTYVLQTAAGNFASSDDMLYNTPIEIRVYN